MGTAAVVVGAGRRFVRLARLVDDAEIDRHQVVGVDELAARFGLTVEHVN